MSQKGQKGEAKVNVGMLLLGLVGVILVSPLLLWGTTLVLERVWHWYLEADYGAGPSRTSWIGIQIFVGWAAITIRHKPDDDPNKPGLGYIFDAVLRVVLNAAYFLIVSAWVRVFLV